MPLRDKVEGSQGLGSGRPSPGLQRQDAEERCREEGVHEGAREADDTLWGDKGEVRIRDQAGSQGKGLASREQAEATVS
jgi:hypothetical protein